MKLARSTRQHANMFARGSAPARRLTLRVQHVLAALPTLAILYIVRNQGAGQPHQPVSRRRPSSHRCPPRLPPPLPRRFPARTTMARALRTLAALAGLAGAAAGAQLPAADDSLLAPRVESLHAMVAAKAGMVAEARWNARASFAAAAEADDALRELQRMVEVGAETSSALLARLQSEGGRKKQMDAAAGEWENVKEALRREGDALRGRAEDPQFAQVVRRAVQRFGGVVGAEPGSVEALAAVVAGGADEVGVQVTGLSSAVDRRGVPKIVALWLAAALVALPAVGAARFALKFRAALKWKQHLIVAHLGNAVLLMLCALMKFLTRVDVGAVIAMDGRAKLVQITVLIGVIMQCGFLAFCSVQGIVAAITPRGRAAGMLHLGVFSFCVLHLFRVGIPSVRAGGAAPGLYAYYLALTLTLTYLLVWEDVAGEKGGLVADVRGAALAARAEAEASLRQLREGLVGPSLGGERFAAGAGADGRRFGARSGSGGADGALEAALAQVTAVVYGAIDAAAGWLEAKLASRKLRRTE